VFLNLLWPMRLTNPFQKTEYLLQESLGAGLTSRVYKAIRRHRGLNIEQTVALKVLNSKKEVLALKNEIKILSKIRSQHCVQLLGWEKLSVGPALVLEYLEGLSLADLYMYTCLTSELIEEIVAQVQDGLRDLTKNGVWHGDLSARNIFITEDGVVKLLDFGFSGHGGCGTPQFLAPEVWLGRPSSAASDLFSLGLLREDLIKAELICDKPQSHWQQRSLQKINLNSLLAADAENRKYLPLESQKLRREDLGFSVVRAREYLKCVPHTQKLNLDLPPPPKAPLRRRYIQAAAAVLIISFLHPLQPASSEFESKPRSKMVFLPGQTHENDRKLRLDVRSHKWAAVELKTKEGVRISEKVYTPFSFKKLKPGEYKIFWSSARSSGVMDVPVFENRRVRIR
jgi:serine/threonine protein kinase